jgi:hypothetical protein
VDDLHSARLAGHLSEHWLFIANDDYQPGVLDPSPCGHVQNEEGSFKDDPTDPEVIASAKPGHPAAGKHEKIGPSFVLPCRRIMVTVCYSVAFRDLNHFSYSFSHHFDNPTSVTTVIFILILSSFSSSQCP